MSAAAFGRRFFTSTRGRIVALLRRGSRTVEDLARALRLTDNAVRAHLTALERDGLVRQEGVRKGPGAGKPATIFEVPPSAEPAFSRAYAPVLAALLDELADRVPERERKAIFWSVGRRLAEGMGPSSGALSARARSAAGILTSLGGDIELTRDGAAFSIRGCSACPLSAAVARHPDLCQLVEALLAEHAGASVVQHCDHGERPRCRFRVTA